MIQARTQFLQGWLKGYHAQEMAAAPRATPTSEPEVSAPEKPLASLNAQEWVDRVTDILKSDKPLPPGIMHIPCNTADLTMTQETQNRMRELSREIGDRLRQEQNLGPNQFPEDPGARAQRLERQQNFQNWMTKLKDNDPGNVEADYKLGYRYGRFETQGGTGTGMMPQNAINFMCSNSLQLVFGKNPQQITSLSSFRKGFEQYIDDTYGIAP